MSDIYYQEQLMFSKLWFTKENLKKCTSYEEQKGTRYIRRNVYFGIIIFSCLSSTKLCLTFLLICFARKIKGFYQSFFENQVDFKNIMNVPTNTLAKSKNFKKLIHEFVDQRVMITTTLISSCHWKTVTFLLAKKKTWKRVFNTNHSHALTVNYRKIVQKNKLCHSKQQYTGYFTINDVI